MKKKIIYLLLIPLVLLSASCHKKQVQKKPDNLIGRNTMVKLIAESYLIESVLFFNPADTVNRFESTKAYYKDLFDRYGVTREQFNKSIEYYMGDEDMSEKLLSEAHAIILQKKKELAVLDTLPKTPEDLYLESQALTLDEQSQSETPNNQPQP